MNIYHFQKTDIKGDTDDWGIKQHFI